MSIVKSDSEFFDLATDLVSLDTPTRISAVSVKDIVVLTQIYYRDRGMNQNQHVKYIVSKETHEELSTLHATNAYLSELYNYGYIDYVVSDAVSDRLICTENTAIMLPKSSDHPFVRRADDDSRVDTFNHLEEFYHSASVQHPHGRAYRDLLDEIAMEYSEPFRDVVSSVFNEYQRQEHQLPAINKPFCSLLVLAAAASESLLSDVRSLCDEFSVCKSSTVTKTKSVLLEAGLLTEQKRQKGNTRVKVLSLHPDHDVESINSAIYDLYTPSSQSA